MFIEEKLRAATADTALFVRLASCCESDSSGYSDGGGGRGMGESVFDIADSDDEESDGVSCSSSKVR